jgi:hypothetical protein
MGTRDTVCYVHVSGLVFGISAGDPAGKCEGRVTSESGTAVRLSWLESSWELDLDVGM